jgi:hypothetical protein
VRRSLPIAALAATLAAVPAAEAAPLIFTFAGNGARGPLDDGGLATNTAFKGPAGVLGLPDGSAFVADTINQRVRRIDLRQGVFDAAGSGGRGFAGDGGAAPLARLQDPVGLAIAPDGSVYIADSANHRIRVLRPNDTIETFAGDGEDRFAGDGGPARDASLAGPSGVALAADGTVLIADTDNHRIRAVRPDGVIYTFSGTGTAGFGGDGGPVAAATYNSPTDVEIAPDGAVLVADSGNNRVRRLAASGVSTIAGNGGRGFAGDGRQASRAALSIPLDVAFGPSGTMYIADSGNHRVRAVTTGGIISTFAGTGSPRFGGDGGRPSKALLNRPAGLGTFPDGSLLIADADNDRVRLVAEPGQAMHLGFALRSALVRGKLVRTKQGTRLIKPFAIPYALTIRARLTVEVRRRRGGRLIATFRGTKAAGTGTLAFPDRLRSGKRRLKKDLYRLQVRAAAAGRGAIQSTDMVVK